MRTQTNGRTGCHEYNNLERRCFLRQAGRLSAAAALAAPAWLPKLTFAADDNTARDLLVCVFLRGAADGLSLCVPHGDSAYYIARPKLSIPRPDAGDAKKALDLDGFFGLAPAFSSLMPAYDAKHLAIVHASGSPDPTRSHFEAMDFMEAGTPGASDTLTGWLARHLQSVPSAGDGRLRGIAALGTIPRSLGGAPATIALPSIEEYGLIGEAETNDTRKTALNAMYESDTELLRATAANITATIDLIAEVAGRGYSPSGKASYPETELGIGLRTIAQLDKADVGLEVACVDLGGWDTHADQGPLDGEMAALMTGFSDGLAAFYTDMADRIDRTTVIVMSEFGRRVEENGSLGTDHGHGSAMFVLGGNVNGGQVIADWPGLDPDQLDEGRDLRITTDYRDVVAEVLQKRAANTDLASVFPDYQPTFRNVIL